MTARPGVSVVIPCFNAAAWIRETLRSVDAQQWAPLEIIAIDDGSTDGTAGIIRAEWPRATVVVTRNHGASRARNLGTGLARGEFIQYLDADDLLTEGKLQAQVRVLQTSGADVAYGDFQRLEQRGDRFVPGELVSRTMKGDAELELFGDFWCPPAVYLFRRRIVSEVGEWNEGLPVIQDARFALDCALRGGRFVRTPGLMAYYRVHPGDSLSRRDPVAFCRDVHRNAREVEAWWLTRGGITADRRRALVASLGYVARSSFERDPETFEAVLIDLHRLAPGYAPDKPLHLRLTAKLIGYRRAERAAAYYRRAKRRFVPTAA